MFLRKFITRAVLVFALFFLFTRPASAADLVNHTVIVLHAAADNIAGFINDLD